MKTKYIIYRRLFNPGPERKDIEVLVATFGRTAQSEAKFCLAALQKTATDLVTDTDFSRYRYTLYTVPDAPGKDKPDDLQLDTSRARSSGRAFCYNLTWDVKHGRCKMLAYHELYGSIRAEVDDTVEARNFFVRAIKRVWRNASISTK